MKNYLVAISKVLYNVDEQAKSRQELSHVVYSEIKQAHSQYDILQYYSDKSTNSKAYFVLNILELEQQPIQEKAEENK